MNLYRITIEPTMNWCGKKYTLYAVQPSESEARRYIGQYLKEGYKIARVSYLGYDLSFGRCMFKGGKPPKTEG